MTKQVRTELIAAMQHQSLTYGNFNTLKLLICGVAIHHISHHEPHVAECHTTLVLLYVTTIGIAVIS